MENQQYIQEDEIDLRDYVKVVIKRKKFILIIFLVSIVAAAIASLLMPKVYEITSTIQLGNVNDEFSIKKEKAKEIVLNRNFLLSIIKELNLKIGIEELRKNIKVDFEEFSNPLDYTSLIKISITYPGLDMALKVYDAIVNPLIAEGKSLYQKRLAITHEWLKEIDGDIKNAEADIERTQTLISGLSNSSNLSQSEVSLKVILLQNTLPDYEKNIIALREQKNKLELTLVNAKEFKIFDPPIKPVKPIMPMELNVLIVGIISLVFGVFLAFFIESWQKGKE